MNISEFIELTNFVPSEEEYREIEQDYYIFQGSKQEFCRHFIDTGRVAEIYKKRIERIAKLEADIEVLGNRVDFLTSELEREEEWRACDVMTNAEYQKLIAAFDTKILSEIGAKKKVADELGFDIDKISIIYDIGLWEKNRHNRLRCVGLGKREPCYNASDWNYICFSVCEHIYEMKNGTVFDYAGN